MSSNILPYHGIMPRIGRGVFIAPNATVIGDVEIGDGTSIWFGCVLRGDDNSIRIGRGSNIQDNSVVHVAGGDARVVIGDNVLIGHLAMIHGCTIESDSFIGMHSTILDFARIESGAMVAAGTLVPPRRQLAGGKLWAGSPARVLRDLSDAEREMMRGGPLRYQQRAREYIAELGLEG